MANTRGYSVSQGYNVDDLDQDIVKQVQRGKNWDENDQKRYDAIAGAKSKAQTVANKPKAESTAQKTQTQQKTNQSIFNETKKPAATNTNTEKTTENPAYDQERYDKMYERTDGPQYNPTSPWKDAKGKAQAYTEIKNQQEQNINQDNDINTNITGDNNKVFNEQDNSIRQYGGDNRSLVINESAGGGKGNGGYYTAADKAITMGTLSGFYDVDNSPAAQAKFVDQQQTMNRDAQKQYSNYGSKTASKYTGYRGGDVNIRALQSRLDKNHQYFFDLAKLQEVKTYGDRAAVTSYPEFKLGDPIKPVESNAGDIADKYRDDIDDM